MRSFEVEAERIAFERWGNKSAISQGLYGLLREAAAESRSSVNEINVQVQAGTINRLVAEARCAGDCRLAFNIARSNAKITNL